LISKLLVQQVTSSVEWNASIHYCKHHDNVREWIAIGPGKSLANLLRRQYPYDRVHPINSIDDINHISL
jgi:[acyl-carrier-protein] S-malonyltransferase